ncbi:hypothetical protein LCGC14_0770410 [marine sediment metagenome]|uniref:Uncharacterized protein n=1 Tax=marine sediment metagenome TaxID=412755 RepID=A0A0F9PYH5_9ZZZZ
MGEFITIIFDTPTGEKCVICGFKLTAKFPSGFPDEWKICCSCKTFGENIIIKGVKLIKDMCSKYDQFNKYSKLIDKIYKHITLVG